MSNLIVVVLSILFFVGQVHAAEISLLETNDVPKVLEKKDNLESQSVKAEQEDDSQEDDFEEMDDFIRKENERLKDIKLLNLDLEKAGLELKKREIEQKMSQFNKDEAGSSAKDGIADSSNRPSVKLLGVFLGGSKKQAVLSINGKHSNLKEGQEVSGIAVKIIKPNLVTIQYMDGQSQELRIL